MTLQVVFFKPIELVGRFYSLFPVSLLVKEFIYTLDYKIARRCIINPQRGYVTN